MPLIGNDRALYEAVAPQLTATIEARLERLIGNPRKIDAGYVQGMRDALRILNEAAEKLAKS